MIFRGILALAVLVFGAPTIDVRARARVTVSDIRRTGSGVHVRGALVDAGTNAGIAGRDVVLRIEGDEVRVTTGPGGRFDAVLDLPPGEHQVSVRFEGDDAFGEARLEAKKFDVGKGSLILAVRLPPDAEAAAGQVEAQIEAQSSGGPEEVKVTVRVGDASGAGNTRAVGEVTTGRDGTTRVVIPRERLGHPGEKRVLARFTGNDVFNPAEGEGTFLLYTTTQLSDVHLPSAAVRYESDLKVQGKLLDAEGNPVTSALVQLGGPKGQKLAEAVTDQKGRFTLKTPAGDLGPGQVGVTIDYTSKVPWRRGTRSGPYGVQILAPRPVPIGYTFAAFGVTACAVFGFVLYRTRPWAKLVAWMRRRRGVPEADGAVRVLEDGTQAIVAPGLKLSRPGVIATLRRPTDHVFSGRVRDAVRGEAIAAARLKLMLGERELLVVTDGGGQFELELDAGTWRVEASAVGFVTETVSATLPHRGELRGVRLDLLPVREKIFSIYREVAAQVLPSSDLWGVWTPREILDHVRAQKPAPALGAFTDFVEDAYFSARQPGEEVLPSAVAQADAARHEL